MAHEEYSFESKLIALELSSMGCGYDLTIKPEDYETLRKDTVNNPH